MGARRWAWRVGWVLWLSALLQGRASGGDAVAKEEGAEEEGLCICVLGYNRPALLKQTLTAVVAHLRADEPALKWCIAWVDNGSDEKYHAAMNDVRRTFGSDADRPLRYKWFETNQGLATAFNTLYFDLCEGYEFALTLEEDWIWNRIPGSGLPDKTLFALDEYEVTPKMDEPTKATRHALEASMGLLRLDPHLLGVSLRGEARMKGTDPWQWQRVPAHVQPECTATTASTDLHSGGDCPVAQEQTLLAVEYRYRCSNPQVEGHVWGSYSNGGSIYVRSRLRRVGQQYGHVSNVQATAGETITEHNFPDQLAEGNYAYRASMHYCMAELRLDRGCELVDQCNYVFTHGGGKGKSTKYLQNSTTFEKTKRDRSRDLEFLVFNSEPPTLPRLLEKPGAARLPATGQHTYQASDQAFRNSLREVRQRLEEAAGTLLDAVEALCLQSDSKDASVADLPELASLNKELRSFYLTFGVFDRPAQPVTWNSMKGLSMLHLMVRSQGRSQEPPPVQMNDAYQNLARYAADLSSLVMLLQTLVACPASGYQHPVIVTHYFSSLGIVIHVGLPESALHEMHGGNVHFMPLQNLVGGIPAHLHSPVYLRYSSTLAALQGLEGLRPADGVLVTHLSQVNLARDPFAWMALLKEEYGIFLSSEIEGYMPGLFERFNECFSSGAREGTTVTGSGAFYTPYLIGGRTSAVSAVFSRMLSVFKTLNVHDEQTEEKQIFDHSHCETSALNLLVWQNVLYLKGDEMSIPIFSGAPFSPSFHWAESPASPELAAKSSRSHYSHYSTYFRTR